MDILGRGMAKIKEFNLHRRERSVASLFRDTKELERKFISEGKRLGIKVNELNPKNHYEGKRIKDRSVD